MTVAARKVRCPRCGAMSVYSTENAFRPFCSQRCKSIDLGAWASGEYAIPGAPLEKPLEDVAADHAPPNGGQPH